MFIAFFFSTMRTCSPPWPRKQRSRWHSLSLWSAQCLRVPSRSDRLQDRWQSVPASVWVQVLVQMALKELVQGPPVMLPLLPLRLKTTLTPDSNSRRHVLSDAV